MSQLGKFEYYPMRKPSYIQPECPVYIYAYTLAVQKGGNAAFTQVRLVNRSDKRVHSVFLQIDGLGTGGEKLYELRYIPLVECDGDPRCDFGEDRPLFLPEGNVYSLEIRVLDVLFEDGMIWRSQNRHRLLTQEQAGWIRCSCGMSNPGEADCCAYCGRPISGQRKPSAFEEPSFVYEKPVTPEEPAMADVFPVAVPVREEPCERDIGAVDASLSAKPSSYEDAPVCDELPVCEETPICEEAPVYEEPPVFSEALLPPVVIETEEGGTEENVTTVPEDLLSLLSPILGRVDDRGQQSEWDALSQAVFEELNREGQQIQEASSVKTAPELTEENAPTREEDPPEAMGETALLLQEIQRRIRARELGEEPDAAVRDSQETETEEASEETVEGRGKGLGFWVFMIFLMIALGLAGFFGVLYLKGYFG